MTEIEWTHMPGAVGETWNPVVGCREIDPACRECYAARIAHRNMCEQHKGLTKLHTLSGGGTRVTWNGKVNLVPDLIRKPLSWRKKRVVFVGSMTDLFYDEVSDDYLDQIFAAMLISLLHDQAPGHRFLLLTKRADRLAEYTNAYDLNLRLALAAANMMENGDAWYDLVFQHVQSNGPTHPGLWLGTTVGTRAGIKRIAFLKEAKARVRFLSCEPVLEYLGEVRDHLTGGITSPSGDTYEHGIDWVICGGESGREARPCEVDWLRDIVEQCESIDIPVFCKQLGSNVIDRNDGRFAWTAEEDGLTGAWPENTEIEENPNGFQEEYQGAPVRVLLKDAKGVDPKEWPKDLRVRQFPVQMPTMRCPRCGAAEEDFDGFGVLAHTKPEFPNGCGYCSHPAYTDGVCDICHESEEMHA